MAQYDGSIRIDTQLNTSEFESSSKSLISGMKRLGNSLNGIISSIGFGLGIAGLVALGKQAIDTASDIEEVQNVVDTAFGNMSYKMEEFAKTSVKQFGISQLSAKQLGSTFMAMGASMLDSAENASNMAINLTARAADMASFYNKSIEETSTALKSIYTGETESLKEYGVVMTQVNLQEFARQQGITKSIQAMTQQEKVMLNYKYVMEQTKLAAGDFAKTSDSWANQTRILSEQFKELLSVLGSGLITALTPVIKFLNTVLTQLISIAKQIGGILSKLFGISIPIASAAKGTAGIASDMSDAVDEMDSAADSAGDLAKGIEKAGKAAKKSLAPFDKLNVLAKETTSGSSNGGSGGSGGSGSGGGAQLPTIDMTEAEKTEGVLTDLQEKLVGIFDVFRQAWKEKGESVISAAQEALKGIKSAAESVGKTFYEVFTNGTGLTWLESVLDVLRSVFSLVGAIGTSFSTAWNSGSGLAFVTEIFEMFTAINSLVATIFDTLTEAFNNETGTAWIQSVLDKFTATLGVIQTLASTLQTAWEIGAGLAMVEAIFTAMTNVNNLITTIADSFSRVWDNGTGVKIWTNILGIVEGVADVIGNLASQIQEAWDTAGIGDGIWQAALDIINTILETIHNIVDSTAEWAGNLDFTPLLNSIKTLLEALEPLTKNIGDGLAWFYENVLLPIAGWAIEDAVPAFLDMLSAAIGAVNEVIEALKPLGQWLWDEFLQPLGEWAGEAAISAMETITDLLDKFGDWISKNKPLVEGFVVVIGSFMAAWGIVNLAMTIGGIVTALVSFVATGGLATAVATALGTAIAFLTSPVTLVVVAIGALIAIGVLLYKNWDTIKENAIKIWGAICDWFDETISAIGEFFTGLWEGIEETFSGIGDWFKGKFDAAYKAVTGVFSGIGKWFGEKWTAIKNVFSNVGSWFSEKFSGAYKKVTSAFSGASKFFGGVWSGITGAFGNITSWFKDKFSTAWEAVKKVFSSGGKVFTGIKDGILSGLKAVINVLIDGINKVIKIPFDGINTALKKIKDIKIVGQKPFGFLPEISVPQIPKLADGAVIRGGDPFMAVLGDQPHGQTNIETPLPTMVKAFKQAMEESGGAGGDVSVRVYLGDKDITKAVKTEADMYFKRTGKLLFGS